LLVQEHGFLLYISKKHSAKFKPNMHQSRLMKWITFAVAFILTVCLVILGIAVYPGILGQAATSNNDFVFALFLGPFFVLLFFSWVGEKIVLRILKQEKN
jgi:hypothetical protein